MDGDWPPMLCQILELPGVDDQGSSDSAQGHSPTSIRVVSRPRRGRTRSPSHSLGTIRLQRDLFDNFLNLEALTHFFHAKPVLGRAGGSLGPIQPKKRSKKRGQGVGRTRRCDLHAALGIDAFEFFTGPEDDCWIDWWYFLAPPEQANVLQFRVTELGLEMSQLQTEWKYCDSCVKRLRSAFAYLCWDGPHVGKRVHHWRDDPEDPIDPDIFAFCTEGAPFEEEVRRWKQWMDDAAKRGDEEDDDGDDEDGDEEEAPATAAAAAAAAAASATAGEGGRVASPYESICWMEEWKGTGSVIPPEDASRLQGSFDDIIAWFKEKVRSIFFFL